MPVSEHAKAMIGDEVTYVNHRGRWAGKEVKGTIEDIRMAGCTIRSDDGEWPGIEFLIAGHWRGPFADRPPQTEAEAIAEAHQLADEANKGLDPDDWANAAVPGDFL